MCEKPSERRRAPQTFSIDEGIDVLFTGLCMRPASQDRGGPGCATKMHPHPLMNRESIVARNRSVFLSLL